MRTIEIGREPVSGEEIIKIKYQEAGLRGADLSVDPLKNTRTLERSLGVNKAQNMRRFAFAHFNNEQRYAPGGMPVGMPDKKISGRAEMNWPKAIGILTAGAAVAFILARIGIMYFFGVPFFS